MNLLDVFFSVATFVCQHDSVPSLMILPNPVIPGAVFVLDVPFPPLWKFGNCGKAPKFDLSLPPI